MGERLSTALGEVICTRRLSERKTKKGKTAIVRLGKPRKKNRNWVCAFFISGIGLHEPVLAYGEDSFQALMMALEGIRVTLKGAGSSLTWVGEDGDSGFPMAIQGFDLAFTRRLEKLVEKEIVKFGKAAEKAHQARTGKRSP